MKIVIIGSGTGALFSTLTIKKHNREAEIVVLDKKDFELLHPCGLPYVIEGKVNSFDDLKSQMPKLGQEFHLKTEGVILWFDLATPVAAHIDRYRQFLRAVSLDKVEEYIDLRPHDRVIYR